MSIYTGVQGIEWEIKVPRDRGKTRVVLSCGEVCLVPGSTEKIKLGEGDLAVLYAKVPGIRVRPVTAKAQVHPEPVTMIAEPEVIETEEPAKGKKKIKE